MAATAKQFPGQEPFHWARIRFSLSEQVPDQWNVHPWGDTTFLTTLAKYTGLKVDTSWYVASLENMEELQKHPFLFMTSEGAFNISEVQQKNLKEYIKRGGFIFADDCVLYNTGDHFFQAFKERIEKLFGKKMVKLPDDHALYRSFYKLNGLPHMQGVNHGGWALFIDDRMSVFLSASDIHCGWCSLQLHQTGGNAWFTQEASEKAVKAGINIVVYAMTH